MASNLLQFLADLAKQPQKLADFKNHPEAIMDHYNLTQEQKDQVLSLKNDNKQHDMQKVIGDELHANFKKVSTSFAERGPWIREKLTRQTITTRKQLIGELTRAAELEHSAICQYLYAAHSLKSHPAESGVNAVQLERVREWQATILLVARGEMEHLGLVCNLLIALGADPVLQRPDFPHEGSSGTRFSLEPFSENALESFVELEASHDGGGVHELYAAIRRGLQTLNDDAVPLFVGNQDAQVCNRSIGLPRQWYDIDVTVVTDLAASGRHRSHPGSRRLRNGLR